MNEIMNYISTPEAEGGFYPTPAHLVQKMLDLVDWTYVSSILEPSAGKGDLAIPAAKRAVSRRGYRADEDISKVDLDCVEIDPNLRAILNEKGLRVVHGDFLTYTTAKRYSLILMNPPFEDGVNHVLKAISLLADGGQMIALLNAESLKNPCSEARRALLKALGDARIDYLPGEFLTAERKTGVEVALISYRKPIAEERPSFIMDNLRAGHKYVEMGSDVNDLSKADFIEAIVDRYNYEIQCGIALINEWRAMNELLKSSITSDKAYGTTLELSCGKEAPSVNVFVRRTRAKYWSALFGAPKFMGQLTTNLRDDLQKQIDRLQDYEFSSFNIYEIMVQMNARVNDGVESTIMSLFDDWTRKYSWRDENSQNRHYFDGWKTNDAFAVNKKVIIPMYLWDSVWGSFDWWRIRDKLSDIEKIMNYLDGGRTIDGKPLRDILDEAKENGQTKKIETKYFYLTIYKKGTAHLEFRNMDLLAKFNIFAAKGKMWLPPAFGKKRYRDLTAEEKRTVDSFMGENASRKYDAVCDHADYFLSTGSTLCLTA